MLRIESLVYLQVWDLRAVSVQNLEISASSPIRNIDRTASFKDLAASDRDRVSTN